jgi:glycosyltransferase involved in cell wall biosynthesis
MRIAIISAFLFDNSIGGIENHIRFMVKELLKRGHEIPIFKPVWQHNFSKERCKIDGAEVVFVNLGKYPYDMTRWSGKGILGYSAGFLNKIAYSFRAHKLVQAIMLWKPDVVWQHDFSSSWLATRRLSKYYPVVLTNHTGEYLLLRNQPYGKLLLTWLMKHYSAVIGPSTELTPSFIKESYTIHNGVDINLFLPLERETKLQFKQKLFGDESKFVIFCPRRWAPTKGIIYLAQAIRELEKITDDWSKFLFVFAGNDYDKYPNYVKEINKILQNSKIPILKLGNLDIYQMNQYYQAADLVVIPSLLEAVSLSALEAMAAGTPVLSTNVGGMPEIIKHGETGYLVEPANANALCKSILNIKQDKRYADIVQNSLDMIRARYRWQKIAEMTEGILIKALNNKHEAL